jgi:hypothetical protein
MHHHVARAVPGSLLFLTWSEASVLWTFLVDGVSNLDALVLMPDHVHLLTTVDNRRSFGVALRSYARWRNAARGERGPVWSPIPASQEVASNEKERRSERYVHLNPCRAGLVGDPLEWPFSTYREAVGLAIDPVRRPDVDPAATHAYTSSDPSVSTRGTLLPTTQVATPTLAEVFDAVGGLCRATPTILRRRGPARTLLIRAARVLTEASSAEIADLAEVDARTIQRVPVHNDPQVRLVQRVTGDPRFSALDPGDLRRLPRWQWYRGRR